jgi:cytochrome c551/c552
VARGSRRSPIVAIGEVVIWLLFFALLAPAGFVGWAIGHYTAGGTRTRTVTVSASATASTTSPATTTALSTRPQATTKTTTGSASAQAATGKTLFSANGCGSCHTFKPAGSSGTIGPNLATKPALDANKAHMPLAAFIRESIVKPNAYISPGYPRGVMPQTFGKSLTKPQIDDLVAFMISGKA